MLREKRLISKWARNEYRRWAWWYGDGFWKLMYNFYCTFYSCLFNPTKDLPGTGRPSHLSHAVCGAIGNDMDVWTDELCATEGTGLFFLTGFLYVYQQHWARLNLAVAFPRAGPFILWMLFLWRGTLLLSTWKAGPFNRTPGPLCPRLRRSVHLCFALPLANWLTRQL